MKTPFDNHLLLCESEIERKLLMSYLRRLQAKSEIPGCIQTYVVTSTIDGATRVVEGIHINKKTDVVDVVVIQPQVGPYRPDFVIWRSFDDPDGPFCSDKAAVEADGHLYHDATRERAARDKRRDRDLQKRGLFVLRFTGSEIHANSAGCARQMDEFLSESGYRVGAEKCGVV
jgi:very-short-patch-repair endonuclease